jgi:hypothetical protein
MTKLGYSYNDYIGIAGVEKTMEKILTPAPATARHGDHRVNSTEPSRGSWTAPPPRRRRRHADQRPAAADRRGARLQNAIEKIRPKKKRSSPQNEEDYRKKRPDLDSKWPKRAAL